MKSDLLLSHVLKHISFSPKEQARFLEYLEEESFFKNEFVLKQGAPCSHIYFVNSGILRAYHINSEGKDCTVMFAVKEWWITDMYCFLNTLPSMVNIQAIAPCTVLKLSKRNLDNLFEELPQFNKFFRVLMQNAYCREQLRTIQNLSLPAKDRYAQFITKYPQIAKVVTLKQIASYLGITPEFLSAIRAMKD